MDVRGHPNLQGAERFLRLNPCFVLAMLLGCILALSYDDPPPAVEVRTDRTVWVRGWISREPQPRGDRIHLRITPLEIRQGPALVEYTADLEVTLFYPERTETLPFRPALEFGEILEFRSYLREFPRYHTPGAPDLERTAWRRGVRNRVRLKSALQIQRLGFHPPALPARPLQGYLRRFLGFSRSHFSGGALPVVLSAFLGHRGTLEEERAAAIRQLGIQHLFVVSGFHVSMVALVLHGLAGRWRVGRCLALAGVWSYVLMTGSSLPTLRAGIMTTVFYLALALGGPNSFLNAVGLSALILLVCFPGSLFSAGFQFSYACLLAIGFLVVPWQRRLQPLGRACRQAFSTSVSAGRDDGSRSYRRLRFRLEEALEYGPRPWVLRARAPARFLLLYWGGLLACAGMIQLLILPLGLFYGNRWIWTQGMNNLLLVPLFSLLIAGTLILFLVFWMPPGPWLAHLLDAYVALVLRLMEFATRWNRVSYVRQPEPLEMGLYFLLLLILLAATSGRGRVLALLAPLWLWGLLHGGPSHPEGRLQITMLDVGQGESIHVRYPDGRDALIDTGGSPYHRGQSFHFVGERLVSRYLWQERAGALEYVLLTHPHSDHVQGLEFLREAFPIRRLLYHRLGSTPPLPRVLRLAADLRFVLAGVQHRILHPPADGLSRGENDGSVVLLMEYGSFKILFTGDIQSQAEAEMAARLEPVQFLKVAHHGADTSTSPLLLERTRPRLALISAGRNNAFGHPARAVLDRLAAAGTLPLSTRRWGSLRIETDGESWRVLHYSLPRRDFLPILEGKDGVRTE